jgi:hypothetical protein
MVEQSSSIRTPSGAVKSKLAIASVTVIVTVRLLLHAFFVPAYEGPDESFHLGRVAAFADLPFRLALRGVDLDGRIVASVKTSPCAAGRAFGSEPASFNLLRPHRPTAPVPPVRNPENNQPPLF